MRLALIGCSLVATVLAVATAAQTPNPTTVPYREGDTWDHSDHEPDPALVPEGSPAQQRTETDELEHMAPDLIRRARQRLIPDCPPPLPPSLTAAPTRSPMPTKAGDNECVPGPS